jgi:hypothetical protein
MGRMRHFNSLVKLIVKSSISEFVFKIIFRPTIFKFWILIENHIRIRVCIRIYIRINDSFGFFDSSPISSEIELGLGPYQIKIFFYIFYHYLRIFPIPLKFRVDPMTYFGTSSHQKK